MKKIALLIVLSALLLSTMVVPVRGQVQLGIHVGDWFKYQPTLVSWVSSGPVTFPPMYLGFLQTYNESSWMTYTITDTSVPDFVNYTVVTQWTNGTQTTAAESENITSSMDIMVIGANLTQGAVIRPDTTILGVDWPAHILGAPIMYNGRETNVCNYSVNIFGNVFYYVWYWDKLTGIQVYYENWVVNAAGEFGGSYSYDAKLVLVDSSTGVVIPEGPILLLAGMSLAAVPVVLLHRRKKPLT
jgi:hypothetical protein